MRHLSQAPTKALISLAAAVGLLVGASAAADTVYKWKDANGQSHYSQQPPDGVKKYETINSAGNNVVDSGDASAQPTADVASGKKDAAAAAGATPAQQQRQQLCKQAHDNATLLTQHATVSTDLNGDGKQVTLNAAQHDQALKDANKAVDLYCQ